MVEIARAMPMNGRNNKTRYLFPLLFIHKPLSIMLIIINLIISINSPVIDHLFAQNNVMDDFQFILPMSTRIAKPARFSSEIPNQQLN